MDPARFFIGGAGGAAKHTEPNTGQQIGQQRTVMKVYLVVSCLQFTDTLNKYNYIKYK
jgi:hypothetical protein